MNIGLEIALGDDKEQQTAKISWKQENHDGSK
jgi:hypothetical protein